MKRSLALGAVLLVASGAPLLAATLTVKSTADAGGTCSAGGTDCTLRQAIAASASGDTIIFFLPQSTYTDCAPICQLMLLINE